MQASRCIQCCICISGPDSSVSASESESKKLTEVEAEENLMDDENEHLRTGQWGKNINYSKFTVKDAL